MEKRFGHAYGGRTFVVLSFTTPFLGGFVFFKLFPLRKASNPWGTTISWREGV